VRIVQRRVARKLNVHAIKGWMTVNSCHTAATYLARLFWRIYDALRVYAAQPSSRRHITSGAMALRRAPRTTVAYAADCVTPDESYTAAFEQSTA